MNTVTNKATTHSNELNILVRTSYVGLDTCTVMHAAFPTFAADLRKSLISENTSCFTIGEVIQELQKHADSDNKEAAAKAQAGLQLLHKMVAEGLMTVYEPAAVRKSFADASWLSLFNQMRTRYALALITQDVNLALDVLNHVNGTESVHANPVKVRRINGQGQLGQFSVITNSEGKFISRPIASPVGTQTVAEDFMLPSIDADEGSVLYSSDRTPYTLDEEMNIGSESTVFRIKNRPELLAKIFVTPTNNKFEKVKLLSEKKLVSGAVLPKAALFDGAHRFAGYVMEKKNGVSVESLFTLSGQKRHAPHWTRRDFAVLARSITLLVNDLLNAGILVGDISASNFLIGYNEQGRLDPTKVYAIDLDSAQITDRNVVYPSDGITPNYAAPEILRDGIKPGIIRKPETLSYAVSVLTLQIILCGVHPFRICSADADATMQDAMKAENLPFGTGEMRRSGVAPSGIEKLWSNMPKSSKEFYHSILQKGMKRNAPSSRPSLPEISKELTSYICWLDDKSNQTDFPEILSLNPTDLKPFYAFHCATPGCTSPKFRVDKPNSAGKYYCPSCQARRETQRKSWESSVDSYRRCSCGNVFAVTNSEKKLDPKLCPTCRSGASSKSRMFDFLDEEPFTLSKPVNSTPKPVSSTPKPVSSTPKPSTGTYGSKKLAPSTSARLMELFRKLVDL